MKKEQDQSEKPFVLCIGGFDPSGGAGVLADTKTIEHQGGHALAVISANTNQTDSQFLSLYPIAEHIVLAQVDLMLKRFDPQVIKIGLLPCLDFATHLLDRLQGRTVVWDPVWKASSGFSFHQHSEQNAVIKLLDSVTVLTPNWPEAQVLFPQVDFSSSTFASQLQNLVQQYSCAILLKAGHRNSKQADDLLITQTQTYTLPGQRLTGYDKHGTGCMLASALATALAKGESIHQACLTAKAFVRQRMLSNKSLLAYFDPPNPKPNN